MQRTVRALVSYQDRLLGAVPEFELESPWWPDTQPVAARLDVLLGVPTTVLRLISVDGGEAPAGGMVTYLVEVTEPPSVDFQPHDAGGLFDDHPLRAPYARPGGVGQIVAWADSALGAAGIARTGRPVQIKTWNLSCVLSIPTDSGTVWCKSTREFETPEQIPIALVGGHDPALVPVVLGHRPGDVLFADVPGDDCWNPDAATVAAMVRRWVSVQAALADTDLQGLPRRLLAALPGRLAPVLPQLAPAARDGVAALLGGLPSRLAALAACGLPVTVVHGDFHSGNWRAGPGGHTLMDWSDAFAGHPANDIVRLVAWPPALADTLGAVAVQAWCDAWRSAVPGCDPLPAIELVRPLVFLEAACFYQGFLDGIEPSEWPYHAGDSAAMVDLALAATGLLSRQSGPELTKS